ncbi:unnamed protein product [Scytosiphon promiscuus]
MASATATALLVALESGPDGRTALEIWSDFVVTARARGGGALAAAAAGGRGLRGKEADKGWGWPWGFRGGGARDGEGEREAASAARDGRSGGGRGESGGDVGAGAVLSSGLFPAVWVVTSDPAVDRAIREGMPHLSSFFVPGLLDGGGGGDSKLLGGEAAAAGALADSAQVAGGDRSRRRRLAEEEGGAAATPVVSATASWEGGERKEGAPQLGDLYETGLEPGTGAAAAAAAAAALAASPTRARASRMTTALSVRTSHDIGPPPSPFLGDGDGGGGDGGGGGRGGGRGGAPSPPWPPTPLSWSDVLERFLSENPGVDVFGLFGEGALPSPELLPSLSPRTLSAAAAAANDGSSRRGDGARDAGAGGGGGGGRAIEAVLWPVLSTSVPPTAVLSRARALWVGGEEEEGARGGGAAAGLGGGGGRVGDWMPDRFVAQIWCNRAMLATARRKATGLGEPQQAADVDRDSFLHVVQRLVRDPGAIGAVLVDGTRLVPSRFLCRPAHTSSSSPGVSATGSRSGGSGSGGGGGGGGGGGVDFCVRRTMELERRLDPEPSAAEDDGGEKVKKEVKKEVEKKEHVYLQRLAQGAKEKLDQQQQQQGVPASAFPTGKDNAVTRTGAGAGADGGVDGGVAPTEPGRRWQRKPLPEVDFYIGALGLALGLEVRGASSPAAGAPDDPTGGGSGGGGGLRRLTPSVRPVYNNASFPATAAAFAAAGVGGGMNAAPWRGHAAGNRGGVGEGAAAGVGVGHDAGERGGDAAGSSPVAAGGRGRGRGLAGSDADEAGGVSDAGARGARDSGVRGEGVGSRRGGGGSSGGGDPAHPVGAIVRAPWPPDYILDNVVVRTSGPLPPEVGSRPSRALDDERSGGGGGDAGGAGGKGVVVVTSVNCGYLDMAVNFLLSVRRVGGNVKVLFVAMDEASYDFLDDLSPGCAVLFPQKSSKRRHAVKAGQWGDAIFKHETVVRPDILMSVMRQGYRVLWTDVDIVWLGNPLPLLPDTQKNVTTAEVMLQIDGKPINKCTCFMYLDSTPNAMRLLDLWKREIVSTAVSQNQMAFQKPLVHMEAAGLKLKLLPDEVMPPGFKIFDDTFMKDNYQRYQGKLLMVHNNWIIGHDAKRSRFRKSGLWEVEDWEFPTCARRRRRRWRGR